MDGKGRCHDNIFIERLWRTVKYEYLYLHAFEGGQELNDGLKSWVGGYSHNRPHQGLGYKTPDEVCYAGQEGRALVAWDQRNPVGCSLFAPSGCLTGEDPFTRPCFACRFV